MDQYKYKVINEKSLHFLRIMADLVEPDGWDICCRPPRESRDFKEDALTHAEVFVLLRYNQSGIITAIIVQALLVVSILAGTLIPGFALFDGAAGEVSAVSHPVWMIAEVFALMIGCFSVFFGLNYTREGMFELNVSRIISFLRFYIVVLVIAILANITHTVFAFIEGSNCTSTLCVDHYTWWIVLICVLLFLVLVECWLIYRAYTYSRHLFLVVADMSELFTLPGSTRRGLDAEPLLMDDEGEPENQNMEAQLLTPFLKKVQLRHGLKTN